ncbi:MAG TPA: type II secretion system protein GspG [Terriglobales bacterium]|nr:type II secretion system protein GspG [Terriglobales bacterium]
MHVPKPRQGDAAPRRRSGFTLVEILVVITIIGLIMAIVGPHVLNYLGESKIKAARIQIESLGSALDLYYVDMGRYPNSNDSLAALVQQRAMTEEWNGAVSQRGSRSK